MFFDDRSGVAEAEVAYSQIMHAERGSKSEAVTMIASGAAPEKGGQQRTNRGRSVGPCAVGQNCGLIRSAAAITACTFAPKIGLTCSFSELDALL